jgi:cell division protease FtsH
VDTEVKRILDDAHEKAREILDKEEDLLERIAQALLERETLDRSEIQLLDEGKELPPLEKLIIPGAPVESPLLQGSPQPEAEPEPSGDSPTPEEVGRREVSPLTHALDRRTRSLEEPGAPPPQDEVGQEELELEEGELDRTPK